MARPELHVARDGQMPVVTMNFVVPKAARAVFFSEVTKYATDNGFYVRIAPIHPVKEQFSLDLRRQDVFMSGDNVFDDAEFSMGLYAQYDLPIDTNTAQSIALALMKSVAGVPGVGSSLQK